MSIDLNCFLHYNVVAFYSNIIINIFMPKQIYKTPQKTYIKKHQKNVLFEILRCVGLSLKLFIYQCKEDKKAFLEIFHAVIFGSKYTIFQCKKNIFLGDTIGRLHESLNYGCWFDISYKQIYDVIYGYYMLQKNSNSLDLYCQRIIFCASIITTASKSLFDENSQSDNMCKKISLNNIMSNKFYDFYKGIIGENREKKFKQAEPFTACNVVAKNTYDNKKKSTVQRGLKNASFEYVKQSNVVILGSLYIFLNTHKAQQLPLYIRAVLLIGEILIATCLIYICHYYTNYFSCYYINFFLDTFFMILDTVGVVIGSLLCNHIVHIRYNDTLIANSVINNDGVNINNNKQSKNNINDIALASGCVKEMLSYERERSLFSQIRVNLSNGRCSFSESIHLLFKFFSASFEKYMYRLVRSLTNETSKAKYGCCYEMARRYGDSFVTKEIGEKFTKTSDSPDKNAPDKNSPDESCLWRKFLGMSFKNEEMSIFDMLDQKAN